MEKIKGIEAGNLSNQGQAVSFYPKADFQQMLELEISQVASERELVMQCAAYLPYRYAYLKSPIYLNNKKL